MTDDGNSVLLDRGADEDACDPDDGRGAATITTESTPRADGIVTASTPLHTLTREEAEAVVRDVVARGARTRFTGSRTTSVELEPVDPGDRVFESAFNDRGRRALDGDRRLGPDAASTLVELLGAAGWSAHVSESERTLDASEPRRLARWLRAWIEAGVRERPALREWADEYLRTRMSQLAAGTLSVTIHQQEILAWSP